MRETIRHGTRILITTGTATSENFASSKSELLKIVQCSIDAGVEILQIREKTLPARMLAELTAAAVELVARSSTKIFVNERFDIAIAAKAHGVHLTSSSIPVEKVRQLVPEEMIVGVSVHTANEVAKARDSGADYVTLGPIFATPGKGAPIGPRKLSEVCSAVAPFPIVGVGGIDGTNMSQIIDAGAAGFAAIRYLNDFVKIRQ